MISQIEIIYIIIVFLLIILFTIQIFKIIELISIDRYYYLITIYGSCKYHYFLTKYTLNYSSNILLICINITSLNGNLNYTVRYLVPAT